MSEQKQIKSNRLGSRYCSLYKKLNQSLKMEYSTAFLQSCSCIPKVRKFPIKRYKVSCIIKNKKKSRLFNHLYSNLQVTEQKRIKKQISYTWLHALYGAPPKILSIDRLKALQEKDAHTKIAKNYYVVRPLLHCSRSLLGTICKHSQIPVYPDKSNQSVRYSRNRIRKQILPCVKIFLNPQAEDALFRFAEITTKQTVLNSKLFRQLETINRSLPSV